MSSSLSGSAANIWEDILAWKLSHLAEIKKAFINRFLVVLLGALTTGVAFLAASVPGPMIQVIIGLNSAINGPLLAIFLLGAVSKHANWKGTMLGGIVGVVILLWLCIGAITVKHKHPPLPPVSTEQCPLGNGSSTLFFSPLNYTNYTSLESVNGILAKDTWNETDSFQPGSKVPVTPELRGLENFYAISYLWFTFLGTIITGTIGIIASLIMRDKDLEAKVGERLLMRVNICGWTDENENEEHLDDKNYTALQEIKGLNERDDEDAKRTFPNTSDNPFRKKVNCDPVRESENGLGLLQQNDH